MYTFPSTIKAIINDWITLREILGQITTTLKDKKVKNSKDLDNLMQPLSDTQLTDALNGPYHQYLAKLVHKYSEIGKLRLNNVINQDDNIKPHIHDREVKLPENVNREISSAALDKLQRQLDELAKTQLQQWQDLIQNWQEQLLMQLTMNDITLSEIEIEELSQQEVLSELQNRFNDLNITLPRKKHERYNFSDYLRLQVMLCLHSCLSRQHKPHDDGELQKIIKKFRGDFKQITQQENELLKNQNTELEAVKLD